MKRSTDEEEHPVAEAKQPQAESQRGLDGQTLTPNDAFTYLKLVNDVFQDNKPIYDQFLELLKDFNSKRISTVGVVERVKELFQGHQDLIIGFNTFLPAGYVIKLSLEDPAKKVAEVKEAICFINKIRARFRTEVHVYNSFIEILYQFRNREKFCGEVHREVFALFENHRDLREEFAGFLPDSSSVAADKLERT